jgi:hypothetical protein
VTHKPSGVFARSSCPRLILAFASLTFALLFNANVASAQRAINDGILDMVNEGSSPYMYSGNYWNIGGSPSSLTNTDLQNILPTHYVLSFPTTSLPGAGGSWTCNGTNYNTNDEAFIESTQGAGITGLKVYASFNNSTGPIKTLTPPQNLNESVFFNENQCYTPGSQSNPSREYGFFLTTYTNQIWAYWSTYTNNSADVSVVQFPIPSVSVGTAYYFEIYPVLSGSGIVNGCGFEIYVWSSGGQLLSGYPLSVDVDGANLPPGGAIGGIPITGDPGGKTSRDPNFCPAIQADTGYVSANMANPYNASGTIPSASTFNLHLYAIAVSGLY